MEHGNLDIGDMRLVKYEHKVGRADYRLYQVIELQMTEKDMVRTMVVARKAQGTGESSRPYRSKKLKNIKLAVCRPVLMCRMQEAKNLFRVTSTTMLSSLARPSRTVREERCPRPLTLLLWRSLSTDGPAYGDANGPADAI